MSTATPTPRAWITGIGVICGLGADRQAFGDGLRHGRCGIDRLTRFGSDGYRSPWAAQAPDPPEASDAPDGTTLADLFALAAAREAAADAGLTAAALSHAAVVLGVGAGTTPSVRDERAIASELLETVPADAVDLVADRLGAGGPRSAIMTACSSSAIAIGIGLDLIRLGRANLVFAGGTEALTPLTYGGFSALKAMAPDPCRPFHLDRRGLTLGEGAAVLLLERADRASRRGRLPYAELAGYGVSCDAHHVTAPHPQGRGAVKAMRAALSDARIAPGDVQYINAHGTATISNDAAESLAICQVFGDGASAPPVSSTKSATGHTLGAAGAIEAAACALAMREQLLPATLGLDRPDPALALQHVGPRPRPARIAVAISNSFAFGGNNATLVFRSVGDGG